MIVAPYYSDQLISEIVAANDIVDLISFYVRLKRGGNSYKGLCPFHSEKTPSFSVSPDKQAYHCFGCGAGGGAVQFVRQIENLDYVEAIKFLAQRAGIVLPEGDDQSRDAQNYQRKMHILQVNKLAAKVFYNNLTSPIGEKARQYLIDRQFGQKAVTGFGVGFAPDSFDDLIAKLRAQDVSDGDMLMAGLVKKSEKTGRIYDFYRGRIMFPIIDVRGNVIGFGGRILGEGVPKYLNSSDSMVFNKSKTLYALNFAKQHCKERIILCEGYVDVIALHQAGFKNAVATLGTALTPEHARLLMRYTGEVVLCYDSDAAGQKATDNAIQLLGAVGLKTKVLRVKRAKDPDEFIKKFGAEAFTELLDGTQHALLYQIQKIREKYNPDRVEEKIAMINEMAAVFASVDSAIDRELLVKEIAVANGISAEAIFTEIRRLQYKNSKKRNNDYKKAKNAQQKSSRAQQIMITNKRSQTECMLLLLMLGDTRVYNHLRGSVAVGFFENSAVQSAAKEVFAARENKQTTDISIILAKLDPEYAKEISLYITKETAYEDNLQAALEMKESLEQTRQKQKQDIESPEQLLGRINQLKDKHTHH